MSDHVDPSNESVLTLVCCPIPDLYKDFDLQVSPYGLVPQESIAAPPRMPRTAKFAATLRYETEDDGWENYYYLSQNRRRDHWFLWRERDFVGGDNERERIKLVAHCRIGWMGPVTVLPLIMKEYLRLEKFLLHSPPPTRVIPGRHLNENHVKSDIQEIWASAADEEPNALEIEHQLLPDPLLLSFSEEEVN